jgi:hypothetical protein
MESTDSLEHSEIFSELANCLKDTSFFTA